MLDAQHFDEADEIKRSSLAVRNSVTAAAAKSRSTHNVVVSPLASRNHFILAKRKGSHVVFSDYL